jgi:hypothetical protein
MGPDRSRSDRSSTPLRTPPGREARSVFAKINDFVQSRQKLPLWVFAGALFLFSVPFAATFFYNAPDQRANFDQQAVIFNRTAAASNDLLHIIDVLTAEAVSVNLVAGNYNTLLDRRSHGDPLDRHTLEQGQNLIRTALHQISVAEAAVSSADLPDATLNADAKAQLPGLQYQQTKMEIMGRLYAAALQSNGPSVSTALADLGNANDRIDAAGEAALTNLRHFLQEGDRFYDRAKIDIGKFTENRRLFQIHEVVAWGAAIYSALFAMLVLYVLANQLLKSSSRA